MLTKIINFFSAAGWLANAFSIGIPSTMFLGVVFGWIKFFRKKSNLDSLLPKGFATTWSIDKVGSLAQIAIVDDQISDFPATELRRGGFQIKTFKQVKLSDIDKLSSFDIVFLDMKGVVKDDPEYGGLKLIEKLRSSNPYQKICAVSGQTFDPTATRFFKLADDYKKKPLTAHECKEVIEQFAGEIFDPEKVLEHGRLAFDRLRRKTRINVVEAVRKFTVSGNGRDVGALRSSLLEEGVNEHDCSAMLKLARMIARETD
ncbi:hypothetical protein C0Z18_02190 [Trinickia dabaoshanensis]|uniref:Response regulatory domain-containing protein n=1 Tax=Trinickia dabaoshanensis TaxID=564714 RepID=A0A2N7W108_9BURK|nr:hypothetical protein C0Z18_02190 [Trinickia dabaoshanensis]